MATTPTVSKPPVAGAVYNTNTGTYRSSGGTNVNPQTGAAISSPSSGTYNSIGGQTINNANSQVIPPANNIASTVSSANNYSPTPTANPVVTSKMAQDDFTTKLTAYQDLMNQMNATADVQAKTKLQAQADQAQRDITTASQNLESQKVGIQQQQANTDATNAQAKLAATGILSNNQSAPLQTVSDTLNNAGISNTMPKANETPVNNGPQPTQGTNDYVNQVTGMQDERTTALNSFLQTSNNMIVGLQNSESALIQATTQNFQNIMNAQAVANASQVGQATQYNARTGQEYSPTQAGSTLASVVAQGNMRLSEINSQMATTVANLQTAFAKERYSLVNEQFAKLDAHFAERLATFKEVHDAVASDLKTQTDETNKKQAELDKTRTELLTKAVGAPQSVLDAISNAGSVAEMVSVGGDYLQGSTGIIGEYAYYKRQAEQNGQTPVDFNTYQDIDANRKAKVASAATGAGYPSSTVAKIESLAGKFGSEASVKSYQVVAEGKSFLDSIDDNTQNPSDQQGVIYAFAKIMDPNSVVREGEYNTVQKYAQSWASSFGFNAARIYSNSPFLSPEAIKNMKETIASKVEASEKNYKNIYDEYARKINKVSGGSDGTEFLTDYSTGFGGTGGDIVKTEEQNKMAVDNFYTSSDETIQGAIDNLINQGLSNTDIVDYFKGKGLIK